MKELDNLAYDFELFSQKEKESKIIDLEDVRKKHNESLAAETDSRKKTKSASNALFISVRNVLFAVVVVAILCMGLYTRSEITKVKTQIESTKSEITALKSEHTRMEMELEASLSVQNIESEAQTYGMQKQEKSQTTYIDLTQEDSAQVLDEDEGGLLENLKVMLGLE